MSSITGFHHVAIRAVDFDASLRFYTEVLGGKIHIAWGAGNDRAVMVDFGGGSHVEIFARAEPFEHLEGTILHFALRTDDCSGMLEKIRAAGMKITMETADVPLDSSIGRVVVRIAFFEGPDGEIVELFQSTDV
jgi:glyoxylase I family protein